MTTLNIAVIGCGIIAHALYFPALHTLNDLYDVRALCDTTPDALPRIGQHPVTAHQHLHRRH